MGHNVAEMLLSPLTESGAYEVMDRSRVETLMKEQNLKFSSRFDSSQAVAYGKILQVDAIVTGTVNNLSVEQIQKTKGVLGVGHKMVDLKATVELTAQMISTETGQIYLAPSAIAEVTEEVGRESGFTDPGAAGSQTAVPRAPAMWRRRWCARRIHQALDDISKDMIRKAPGLPKRMLPPGAPRRAAARNWRRSEASAWGTGAARPAADPQADHRHGHGHHQWFGFYRQGRNAGVRQGDSFEVRHYLKTVTNAAGKQIKLDQKIGDLTIVEVNDDWARGTYAGQTPPQKNDAVRLK